MCICIYVKKIKKIKKKKKKERKKEKEKKKIIIIIISTCVYVHSVLDHWVCILMSRGHFYRVCSLLGVRMWALWDPMIILLLCHIYFVREMSDLLLRTLSHCPFHHYIHYWCDFTSCLIWVDYHFFHVFIISLSFFIVACDSSHSLHILFSPYSNPSRVRYFASSLHISLPVHFASFVSLSISYSR